MRSKLKFIMLVTLIVVALLVFLVVAELSRASRADLATAIDADLGATGTYQVMPSPDLSLNSDQFASAMASLNDRFGDDEPVRLMRVLPPLQPQCPPYEQVGEMMVGLPLDASGRPTPFQTGSAPVADICLAGMVVPNEALREASPVEKALFGVQLVLNPAYEHAVTLTRTEPTQYVGVVVTGATADQVNELSSAARTEFTSTAIFAGLEPAAAAVIARMDSGDRVRAASAGVSLVYSVIAWGVLLVSGLGIGITELIVLKDRTWYFGLVRAAGARRRDVASLVLTDILIVLAVGTLGALTAAALLSPVAASLGRSAFEIDVQLLRPSALPTLLLGVSLMLVIGGAYPAWRATRLDPLEVLERR